MKRLANVLIQTTLVAIFLAAAFASGPPQATTGQPRSSEWPAVRDAHLSACPTCAACGSRIDPQVHHVVPFHKDPTKELDPANLLTLCALGLTTIIFGSATRAITGTTTRTRKTTPR